jgi:hypothetical protein
MNYKEMLEAAKSHRVTHPSMESDDNKPFWITFCEGCGYWHSKDGTALSDEEFQNDLQTGITDNPALEEGWEIVNE